MSDLSPGQGWWLASDGKWYAPELHPDYAPSSSPGWWQASDGRWYPPEQHPDSSLPWRATGSDVGGEPDVSGEPDVPGEGEATPPATIADTVESTDSPNAQWRPDPFGRFESRRFFLGQATSLVKNGDTVGYDEVDHVDESAPVSEVPVAAAVDPVPTPGDDFPTTPAPTIPKSTARELPTPASPPDRCSTAECRYISSVLRFSS